ncbi:DUF4826 family protein [Thalassotalea aquiviva]|uniref:DUF4826 family protein n=1 Tax=Thalassotalea aquiviva TaxID=3242415 RepID=UPI00352A2A80
MSDQQNNTDQQASQWVREQYLKATKYLADKGYVTDSVKMVDSRYLVPAVAVWKLNTLKNEQIWVISGDLPCDHIPVSAASDAREALRNFSLKWQIQAQNLLTSVNDSTQQQFADVLINRAEALYQLFENDKLWGKS